MRRIGSFFSEKNARAFTLVEVLIVLMMVGILAGTMMLVPGSQGSAFGTRIASDLRNLGEAAVLYNALNETWPKEREDLEVFLDRSIEYSDKVCYDIAKDEKAGFVGIAANLSNVEKATKNKLAKLAESMPLYSDIEMTSRYNGENVVYYRVAYGGNIAANSGEALFSSGSASDEDYRQYSNGSRENWRIQDDGTIMSPLGDGEARLVFGDESWTDYTITLTATLDKGSGYGVYYRATGDPKNISGYAFQYDPGYNNSFIVRRVNNGDEESPIAIAKFKDVFGEGFDIYGTSHEIGITVTGPRHTITVDDTPVLEFEDSSYLSGAAGLRVWHGSQGTFKNITVTEVN